MFDYNTVMHSRLTSLVCYAFVFCLGAGVGFMLRCSSQPKETVTILREPEGKYQFISPLIGFNPGEKKEFEEYTHLEKILEDKITTLKADKKVYSTSVYFRDMESGRWTGVNEEELYSPASLYKVALMIAVLKNRKPCRDFSTNVLYSKRA